MTEGYDTPSAPRRTEFDRTDVDRTEYDSKGFGQPDEVVYEVTTSTYADGPVSSEGANYASSTDPDSTTAAATDQAKQVGQEALASGQQVAGVAADQAKTVAAEAGTQAKNLVGEARTQLTDQAATQQNNLATWLHSIVEELDQMVDRADGSDQSGAATSLVRQVSGRARGAASWLQDHEPSDLLAETSRFARRRPGLFLALAAAGGVLAGRLTRGLTAGSGSEGSKSVSGDAYAGQSVTPVVTTTTSGPYTTTPVTNGDVYASGTGLGTAPRDEALYDDDLGVR